MLCFGCALGRKLFPEQPVSRAQTSVSLVSVLVARRKLRLLPAVQTNRVLAGVADADKLPPAARAYFATAVSSGITPLVRGRQFAPALQPARADMAVTLDAVQTQFKLRRLPELKQFKLHPAPQNK